MVTFGGQLRVAGIAFDNLRDFENTDDIPFGQPLSNDATGTWGIGGSVTIRTIPRVLDASALSRRSAPTGPFVGAGGCGKMAPRRGHSSDRAEKENRS